MCGRVREHMGLGIQENSQRQLEIGITIYQVLNIKFVY